MKTRVRKTTASETKRKHYSHAIADEHKRKKRIEAEERQKQRSQRTNKQQLAKLDAGGFAAKKERGRLK